jgi:hypothetical protein
LHADYKDGRVLLRWKAATDNEVVYGYQVFRAEVAAGGGAELLSLPMTHFASVRGASTRFEDARVIGGTAYTYAVRPYDLAGNRGPLTPSVKVVVPNEHVAPADEPKVAKDPGAVEGCTSVT